MDVQIQSRNSPLQKLRDERVKMCKIYYLLQASKSSNGETGSGWMMNRTKDGFKFFFNTKTMEYTWSRTDDVIKDSSLLTKDEVQVLYDAQHTKRALMLFGDNIGSDQHAHLCSLILAFSVCQHILQYPLIG